MLSGWLRRDEEESDWISISDLMSVLMLIFLLIAVSYMYNVERGKMDVKRIAVAYRDLQLALYQDLWEEFKDDLLAWQATIEKETLTVRFEEPDVLFDVGSANVSERFKEILGDFFPRYVEILTTPRYRENIEEIRIEGHTSSEWYRESNEVEAYFHNMRLSQDRTRSVLRYCLGLIGSTGTHNWARKYVSANGLSSSQLRTDAIGREDKRASRRVEFRTRTNAEQRVIEIIERMEPL